MTVAAISVCRNEADMAEGFVQWMATQVDLILIADNGSTDGTRDLLNDLTRDYPLFVTDDPEFAHYQGRKTTALAADAAARGAQIVIPADQDERWYSPYGRIGDVLAYHAGASIFGAAVFNHLPTGEDGTDPDPVARIGWRFREPLAMLKVAARPRPAVTIHDGNHGADYGTRINGLLEVRHFAIRSPEQMIRKARHGAAALAAAVEVPETVGLHWRHWNALNDTELTAAFYEHYYSPDPRHDPALTFDPCPLP